MVALPFNIGLFVMEWTRHERMAASLLAVAEGRGYLVVRDEMLDGPVGSYEKRLRLAFDALPAESEAAPYFARILAEHAVLRDVRHDVVHGFFAGIDANDEIIMKRKIRKGPERIEPLTAEAMHAFFNQLQALGEAVMNAQAALQGKPPLGQS